MYRLTLRQCSQRKETDWGPNFPSTVQSKALYYPVLWNRDMTTTTQKHQGRRLESAVCSSGVTAGSCPDCCLCAFPSSHSDCWGFWVRSRVLGYLFPAEGSCWSHSPHPYHPTQPVRNSDWGPSTFWMSSVKLLETTAFIPIKPVLFLQKEVCFLCNVTVVDVLQCNHTFVKIVCTLQTYEPNHIGFSKCLCIRNIFASIEMYHQRSCVCFFKNGYSVICTKYDLLATYIIIFVYFQHRFILLYKKSSYHIKLLCSLFSKMQTLEELT